MGFKAITFLTVSLFWLQFVYCQIGYATLNGGTTGGAGGHTVTVSTEAELASAVAGNDTRIVRIVGNIQLTGRLRVGSNKSILGASPDAGVYGNGFFINQQSNIIIRGLHISFPLEPADGIEIQRSTNVWVDHNEFWSDMDHGRDFYDGLLDINNGADYITVSWNYFHNHYKVSLFGGSDDNGAVDIGRLRVTLHHNYYSNLNSRIPSLRFGTAHIFNNLYENIPSSTINSRMGAQVLVENNVFRNARRPIVTNLDSREDGYAYYRDNDFGGENPIVTQVGTFTTAPYAYRLDSLQITYNKVRSGAGATIRF